MKNQQQILQKFNISSLNEMQQQAQLAIHSKKEVIILSPTGTGKTLAFLLPIIQKLEIEEEQVEKEEHTRKEQILDKPIELNREMIKQQDALKKIIENKNEYRR